MGNPAGKIIYEVLSALEDDDDIVKTRLVNSKITLLHARVWPAIVRVSDRLGTERLGAIYSEHTESGVHRNHEVPYPQWVSLQATRAAATLSEADAFDVLPACLGIDAAHRRGPTT